MYDPDQQRLVLGAMLLRAMAEANHGREPTNIWQYRRVARRFGVRIRFLPPEVRNQAILRQGQRAGEQGVIYIRRTRNIGQLRRDILHELGEAASRWEGWPPICCEVSRHEAACYAVLMSAGF